VGKEEDGRERKKGEKIKTRILPVRSTSGLILQKILEHTKANCLLSCKKKQPSPLGTPI
jgi:hypothetical protein